MQTRLPAVAFGALLLALLVACAPTQGEPAGLDGSGPAATSASPSGRTTASPVVPSPVEGHSVIPRSVDQLPVGPPTVVPYLQKRVLHAGDTAIALNGPNFVAYRPGITVVGSETRDYRMRYSLLLDGRLQAVSRTHDVREVALSSNGEWAAWVEEQHVSGRGYRQTFDFWTVLYDTRQHREVGRYYERRRVAWEDGLNCVWMRGVNNFGQVFTSSDDRKLVMWRPGTPPMPVRGARFRGWHAEIWPGGFSYSWSGLFGLRGEKVGTVDEAGTFTEIDRVPQDSSWSPNGLRMILQDSAPLELEDPATQDRVALPSLPVGGYNGPSGADFAWEDEQTLLIADRYDGRWLLLRCRIGGDSCERVPGPAEDSPIRLPRPDLI